MCEKTDLEKARALYEKLMDGTMFFEETCVSDVLNRFKDRLQTHAESAKMSSRTSALWVQYMNMVDILRKFIRAERTGNWALHLQAMQDLLPYLAASGHNMYTKFARVYLQQITDLKPEHHDVQQRFDDGFHAIRRSDRQWTGHSSDLIIEKVMMRSLNSSGGLTRGRGMTEHQRLVWLLPTPACAEINRAMQELTEVNYNTVEQNKDMSEVRQTSDWEDTLAVLHYLHDRAPLCKDSSLRSIVTGVHAHPTVNVDTAHAVGATILN